MAGFWGWVAASPQPAAKCTIKAFLFRYLGDVNNHNPSAKMGASLSCVKFGFRAAKYPSMSTWMIHALVIQRAGSRMVANRKLSRERFLKTAAAGRNRRSGQNDCENRASRNSRSLAVAFNCGIGSSSLSADVNAFERLQIVRGRKSSYFGSK